MSFLTYGNGQGHGSSKLTRAISKKEKGSSIVQRLVTRSITANDLDVHVHQHQGYDVHLKWFCLPDEMCMQRTFMWGIDCFVNELLDGGAQDLCDCV
jgi:hypothetical protein